MVATQQRLGALLVEMGFIDDAQLVSALEEQQRSDKRLGKILVEAALLSEDRLVHALSRQLGIEACDPIMTRVHERVLALIPSNVAFKHRVLPVARQREPGSRDVVYVATADPLDQNAHRVIAETLGEQVRVQWMLAGETEMELALARHYGQRNAALPEGTKVITGVPVAGPPRSPEVDGSKSVLATTDDVFAALNDNLPDAATTQPDRALPSLDLDMTALDPLGAPSEDVRPLGVPPPDGEAVRVASLSDASTEEILLADEVVSPGESPNAVDLSLTSALTNALAEPEGPAMDVGEPLPDSALLDVGPGSSLDLELEATLMPDLPEAPVAELLAAAPDGAAHVMAARTEDITDRLDPVFDDDDPGLADPQAPASLTPIDINQVSGSSLDVPLSDASWGDLLVAGAATARPEAPVASPTPNRAVSQPIGVLRPAPAREADALGAAFEPAVELSEPPVPSSVEASSVGASSVGASSEAAAAEASVEPLAEAPAVEPRAEAPAVEPRAEAPAVEPRAEVPSDGVLTAPPGPPLAPAAASIAPVRPVQDDAPLPKTDPLPAEDDLDIDVTEASAVVSINLADVAAAAEVLPIADASLLDAPVDHPASPFPPLEGDASLMDEPEAPLGLREVVEKLTGPAAPSAPAPAPPIRPHETAHNLHRELKFFAEGGAVDLTSQTRLLRTLAAVMMKEGLLEPMRIKAALDDSDEEER